MATDDTIEWGWIRRRWLLCRQSSVCCVAWLEPLPARLSAMEARFSALEVRGGAVEKKPPSGIGLILPPAD